MGWNQSSQADKPILLLASRSPRRREILDAAGLVHVARHPAIDDSVLSGPGSPPLAEGCAPEHHAIGLAYLKAMHALRARVFSSDELTRASWVLGCDTSIAIERPGLVPQLLGTPTDRDDARRILTTLLEHSASGVDESRGTNEGHGVCRGHRVVTGVALVRPHPPARIPVPPYAQAAEPPPLWRVLFADSARVRLGPISAVQLEEYLDSGLWQGKAGGYNLAERQAAGWPVQYDGDPTTIMGLPIQKLTRVLARLM